MSIIRRKNNSPPPRQRQVADRQSAQVFSYYSSRSERPSARSTPRSSTRQEIGNKSLPKLPKISLNKLPFMFAAVAILVCFLYITSLSGDVVIVASNDGVSKVQTEDYQQRFNEIFNESISSKSKLLINTDLISDRISNEFPEFEDVSVALPLIGRRPVVSLRLSSPAVIVNTNSGSFIVDESGKIIGDMRDLESSIRQNLVVVSDESGVEVSFGDFVLSQQKVDFIREVTTHLKKSDNKPKSMYMPIEAHDELRVELTDKSYYLKFDLRGSSRVQAGTAIATIEHLQAEGISPKEYVDARVPGKAYYK